MPDFDTDVMRVLASRGGANPNARAGGRARAKSILSRAASQVVDNMSTGGSNPRVVGQAVEEAQGASNARGSMLMARAETSGEGAIVSAAQQAAQSQEQKIQHEAQLDAYEDMDVFDIAARVGTAATGIFSMTRYLGQKFGNKEWQRATAELAEGPGGAPSVDVMEQTVLSETQTSMDLTDQQIAKYGERITELTGQIDTSAAALEGLSGDELKTAQIGLETSQGELASLQAQMKILQADRKAMAEFAAGLEQRHDARLQASQEGGNLFDDLANPFGIVDAMSVTSFGSAYDAQRLSEQQRAYLASQTEMTRLMDSLDPDMVVAETMQEMTRRFSESMSNLAAEFPEMQQEIRGALIKYSEFMQNIGNSPRIDFGDLNRGLEWIDSYLWPDPSQRPDILNPGNGVVVRR